MTGKTLSYLNVGVGDKVLHIPSGATYVIGCVKDGGRYADRCDIIDNRCLNDLPEWVVLSRNGANNDERDYSIGSPPELTYCGADTDVFFTPVTHPKAWGEMSDAEKGALLLARHNGGVIQERDNMGSWWEAYSEHRGFLDNFYYRIKPPVETVTLRAGSKDIGTIDVCDGVYDIESIMLTE